MKITFLMVIFSISYTIGSVIGLRESSERISEIDQMLNGKSKDQSAIKSDLKVAFKNVLKSEVKHKLVQDPEFSKINGIVNKLDYLSKTDGQEYNDYFDDDGKVGLYLKRILIADSFRGTLFTDREVSSMTKGYHQYMLNHPEETFDSISEFMTTGGVENYPLDTVGLLFFSQRLKKVDEDVKELAYELSTRNVHAPTTLIKEVQTPYDLNQVLSPTIDMLVPIAAYQVYISKETRPIMGIERTIDALSAQKSDFIKNNIFRYFVRKFPQYKTRLAEQLKDRGIVI